MSSALATIQDRHRFVSTELEKARGRLNAIVPVSGALTPSRAIAVALDALVRDPKLLNCDPRSIVRSVIHAAEVGLELGSPLGEAFIVPYGGKATMMIGYRGFARLIWEAPRVKIIKTVLVRAGDTFEIDEGENILVHKWSGADRQRGEITHAYSRVWYQDGASQFEIMDRDGLDKIKTEALAKDSRPSSPWRKHADEMYRKCPLRRQAKILDLTGGRTSRVNGEPLARRAVELDTLEEMRRGELGGLREGFSAQRAEELKAQLAAQDAPVDGAIDVEIIDQ